MVNCAIKALAEYGISHGLIERSDFTYTVNRILHVLGRDSDIPAEETAESLMTLPEILSVLTDDALQRGVLEADTAARRDLFDTELMGLLTPRPSTVIAEFNRRYAESPEAATEYYYALSRASNYIRTDRVARDRKWTVDTPYGVMDITINLSKPEKDPRDIAAAGKAKASGYPLCALCRENEGYGGTLSAAPRANHRVIPIRMAEQDWFLQYSPYIYYNEHCIALSADHVPMKIDRSSFVKMLDFVSLFPHYFIGSNADLPIVGGSILSHDHMQGGNYTFAMARAPMEQEFTFHGFEDIAAGIVRWPMAVIRLRGKQKSRLVELADRILLSWRGYSDPAATIFAETDGVPHNTITPIARMRDGEYELDLVLRNNLTTEEHPMGLYHPHAELHNIKRENIGLIEVMGLAVLPARLNVEMKRLAEVVLAGEDPAAVPEVAHHAAWFAAFAEKYTFTEENITGILEQEIGRTFVRVLEDAGVYRCDADGRAALGRFLDVVGR